MWSGSRESRYRTIREILDALVNEDTKALEIIKAMYPTREALFQNFIPTTIRGRMLVKKKQVFVFSFTPEMFGDYTTTGYVSYNLVDPISGMRIRFAYRYDKLISVTLP